MVHSYKYTFVHVYDMLEREFWKIMRQECNSSYSVWGINDQDFHKGDNVL